MGEIWRNGVEHASHYDRPIPRLTNIYPAIDFLGQTLLEIYKFLLFFRVEKFYYVEVENDHLPGRQSRDAITWLKIFGPSKAAESNRGYR